MHNYTNTLCSVSVLLPLTLTRLYRRTPVGTPSPLSPAACTRAGMGMPQGLLLQREPLSLPFEGRCVYVCLCVCVNVYAHIYVCPQLWTAGAGNNTWYKQICCRTCMCTGSCLVFPGRGRSTATGARMRARSSVAFAAKIACGGHPP